MAGEVRVELVAELSQALEGASRSDRGRLVSAAGERWGLDKSSVYRLLRQHRSGPRPAPRPAERLLNADEAEAISRIMARCRNKRGRVQITVIDAFEIAQRNGQIRADLDVSAATVRRTLDDLRLSRRHLEAPEPSIIRRSLGPNHVHVIDFSPALQWYLRPDGAIEKLPQHMVPRKPDAKAGKPHLWRYLVVDHASGAFFVWYYYAPGENAGDLTDFLYRAWAPKDTLPFHGVPWRVLADQGSPFKAATTQNLLRALDVDVELHSAGNAKASGAVERGHSVWQSRFDSRLALRPAKSLEELNAHALDLCTYYNFTEPHSRHKMIRLSAWSKIDAEDLRVPPSREAWLRLAVRNPETRLVTNQLLIPWHNVQYQLAGPVSPGETVTVVEHPYADGALRVWSPRGEELVAEALKQDEFGYLLSSRSAVFGSDEFQRHPDTPAQRLQRHVDADPPEMDPWPEDDWMTRVHHTFLIPRGRPAIPVEQLPSAPPLAAIDVRERIAAAVGRPLTVDEGDWVDQQVGHGIPEDQVDALIAQLLTPEAAEGNAQTA